MRRLLVACALAVVAGGVASLAVGASGGTPADRWSARDLGAPWSVDTPDGSFLWVPHMEVNARGQILGEGQTKAGRGYTFLWQNGKTIRLPFAPGEQMPMSPEEGDFVGAPSLNDSGQIVGVVRGAGKGPFAAVWEDGKIRRVGAADGALINAGGQVVAWSNAGSWFLWENGRIRARGRFDPSVEWGVWSEQGAIVAINDRGQIAGRALVGSPDHSWLWHNGTTRDLGTPGALPGYSTGRFATDLNERGQVVGFDIPNSPVFLWRDGAVEEIGGDLDGERVAINDRGQILGEYGGSWWLWEAGRLRVRDTYGSFVAINNRGQVVGLDGGPPGDQGLEAIPAFLWVNGKWRRLPLLPRDDGGGALALNERNQIVGISCGYHPAADPHEWRTWSCRAVLWTKGG